MGREKHASGGGDLESCILFCVKISHLTVDVCRLWGNIQWNSQSKWYLEVSLLKKYHISGRFWHEMEKHRFSAFVNWSSFTGYSGAVPVDDGWRYSLCSLTLTKNVPFLSPSLSLYIEVRDLSDLFWKLVECDGGCYLSKYQKIPGFCMLHKQLSTGSSRVPSGLGWAFLVWEILSLRNKNSFVPSCHINFWLWNIFYSLLLILFHNNEVLACLSSISPKNEVFPFRFSIFYD